MDKLPPRGALCPCRWIFAVASHHCLREPQLTTPVTAHRTPTSTLPAQVSGACEEEGRGVSGHGTPGLLQLRHSLIRLELCCTTGRACCPVLLCHCARPDRLSKIPPASGLQCRHLQFHRSGSNRQVRRWPGLALIGRRPGTAIEEGAGTCGGSSSEADFHARGGRASGVARSRGFWFRFRAGNCTLPPRPVEAGMEAGDRLRRTTHVNCTKCGIEHTRVLDLNCHRERRWSRLR